MASFNKVILMGNLTRDPEVRQATSGNYICKFGLAVNRRYSIKGESEVREEVTYVDVDAFNRTAELISKYMSKGSPILIEGRLRLDSWEDKEGNKRNKLMVVCENFQFVGNKSETAGAEGGASASQYDQSAPAPRTAGGNQPAATEAIDDDVPF
jgi:single-strand DNA-binding protein